jgi:hypothetical protein
MLLALLMLLAFFFVILIDFVGLLIVLGFLQ